MQTFRHAASRQCVSALASLAEVHVVAPTEVVGRLIGTCSRSSPEDHKLLRVFQRQWLDDPCIEDREDSRRCADAERQRKDGNNANPRFRMS
jgi:hypothetical protein